MGDETSQDPSVKRIPPNPERWWMARRRFAIYGAFGDALTLVLMVTCALMGVSAEVMGMMYPVFIASLIFHTAIVIVYIAGATYIDKITNPLSNLDMGGQ